VDDYHPANYYVVHMIARKITNKLLSALSDSPVVLLHGARQTGEIYEL